MTDLFKIYNKTLKELIDIISNELSEDELVSTFKRKYIAAVSTDNTILLTESGKELFEYRDYIAEDKWDELINKEWTNDIKSNEDKKSIQHIISSLRGIWSDYDDEEKNHIKKLIKTLLSTYAKYLIQQT